MIKAMLVSLLMWTFKWIVAVIGIGLILMMISAVRLAEKKIEEEIECEAMKECGEYGELWIERELKAWRDNVMRE